MDALPIQDLVDQAKARAINSITAGLIAQAVAITGPLSGFFGSIINWLLGSFIRWLVTKAVDFADRRLFNFNMDIVTADQAADYREAEARVIRARSDANVSDEEYERLEDEANHLFDQLINFAK